MGFTGLSNWVDSDETAMIMDDIVKQNFKLLRKHINAEANEFNTCGAEDVLLALEALFKEKHLKESYLLQIQKLVFSAEKILLKHISKTDTSDRDAVNYNRDLKKMISRVKRKFADAF